MISAILFHIVVGIPLYFYEDTIIPPTNKANFLTSVLQAIAAMVGIVFAISLVVIEHSASNYSPRILKLLKKDWFFLFTLSFGLFTIGFFGLTILNDWKTLLVSQSLFLWNLVLLGIYLWYILHKINPLEVIHSIEFDFLSQIKKIKSQLPDLEKNLVKSDVTGRMSIIEQHTPETMRAVVLKDNKKLLTEFLDDETTLQHIILDAFKREESQRTKSGLQVYSVVLREYLTINPNYQWYNDEFIEMLMSRFESFSRKAVEEKNSIFLQQVISALKECGLVLTEIQQLQPAMQPPQPVSRFIHTCTSIGKESVKNTLWDGALDSIRSLSAIGIICVQKYRMDGYTTNYIVEIGNHALVMRDGLFASFAAAETLRVIQFLIYHKSDTTRTRMAIEGLRDLLVNFQNLKLQTMSLSSLFFDSINDLSIRLCAEHAFRILNEDFPQIETRWREEVEKSAISAIIDLLGKVGIANTNHDTIIAKYCAENLVRIASLCAQQNFHTVENGHKEEIEDIINFLRRLHRYDSNHHSLFSRESSLRLSEVAIICMQNNLNDLAKNCIEKIFDISIKSLEIDEHGYEANRMLRNMNLIGCAAIVLKDNEILDLVIEKIAQFDEEFLSKFNKLPRDELHLDQTVWEVDPFENLSEVFNFKEIMDMENRKQFEYMVTKKRIEKLKTNLTNKKKKLNKTGSKDNRRNL